MINKLIRFVVPGEFQNLPQLLSAGLETITSPSYCWDGAKRKSSPKCLFQYTLDGYGCLSYRGTTYKVGKGKAFVYDLSTQDSCYFYPPGETKPWKFVYCVFSNFESAVEELNATHGPIYNLGERNFMVEKLIALLDSLEELNSTIISFKSYSLSAEIVGEMCRLVELRESGRSSSALVMKARTLLHEGRMEHFSLQVLSSRLAVSPEHLCRVFKMHLNCSPKGYHEKLRVECICERLRSGKSIKEIAEAFGFNDLSNFNKYFKKHCAMTPGQFKINSAPLHDMFGD